MSDEQDRVLSVYELSLGLKQTVETATAGCWVEGEVGRLQRPVSGHLYFSLKDDRRDAMIDCVMYKRDAMRFGARLIEGQRAQLRGRATFYPPRGRLQWVADVAKAAGQGALLEALEKLKQKLVSEGLTDPSRKRPLPTSPRVVGVVTSRTGAAFPDICTVAQRRGKVHLILASAVVQGEGAVQSLLEALDKMERLAPDVLIIGRGGGSAEDLMAFNDERVVRRVAGFAVPVVSAVGHEIDVSLTDLVADARAATPSQAAELVVPDAEAQLRVLSRTSAHMARAMHARVMKHRLRLNSRRTKIGDPRFLLFDYQQALDERRAELTRRLNARIETAEQTFERRYRRLLARHPNAVIAAGRFQLSPKLTQLVATMKSRLMKKNAELGQAGASLGALSPLSVLGRGFALASTTQHRVLRDAASLTAGETVTVVLKKGAFAAKVEKVFLGVDNPLSFDHESPDLGEAR